jgi:hypothetical protein
MRSQEVREFAAKQNASADTFLEATATPTVRSEPVEGLSSLPTADRKGLRQAQPERGWRQGITSDSIHLP